MSLVLLEEKNFVTTIKLNRVDKLNALNWDLIDELTLCVLSVSEKIKKANNTRVVLIGSSTPKSFCAGADLKERSQMTDEKVVETLSKLRKLMDAVAAIPVPTIAVVEGLAFGGGLELALACDIRITTHTSQLGLTETNLAIFPAAGGTQRLPRLIGEAKAKELIFFARKLSGDQAAQLGIVHTVSAHAWPTAESWAEELCKKGPLALKQAKASIDGGRELPLDAALDHEHNCYLELLPSSDRAEGLKAFLEKRDPHYTGQ